MDRVPFGPEDDAPAAFSFERIPDDDVNISGNVLGEIEPEQRPRHVHHVGPDQIAVPVKNGEIAVLASGRGADVLNSRIGHVKAAAARQNNPSRRLHPSFLPITHRRFTAPDSKVVLESLPSDLLGIVLISTIENCRFLHRLLHRVVLIGR